MNRRGSLPGQRVRAADEWRIQHPGRGAWRILEWNIFVTKLLGPEDLKEAGVPSYPCIVIKTRKQEKAGNVPGKQQSGEKRVGERGIDCGIKKRKHADIKGKK